MTAVPRDQTRYSSACPVRLDVEVKDKLDMLWFLHEIGFGTEVMKTKT